MNRAVVPNPKAVPSPALRPSGVQGRDREFLPAALEILETPPSPTAVVFMLTICAALAAALAWSFFGRLDIFAVASGKIEVVGHAKVIQALETAKIAAIHVETGQTVKAGDPLVEFDPVEAAADRDAAAADLAAALGESARRRYVIDAVAPIALAIAMEDVGAQTPSLAQIAAKARDTIVWSGDLNESVRLRELAVLSADISQLSAQMESLDRQMAEKNATRQRLQMSINFQNDLIKTLNRRVSTRQEAIDKAVGTKIELYDALEELQKAQTSLASDQGQVIENDAALREAASERSKAISQFLADYENKFADSAKRADDALQALNKASARLARTRLTAPVDGIVQKLAATTVGQVFTPGQQLMSISPADGRLQVEALVSNLDVGFVKVGQDVVVKVDAFPFTRFGVLHGHVARIASEALDEQEARRALADATSAANAESGSASGGSGQPQVFVFPITVALDETAMPVGDKSFPLSAGMTVTAEVRTDSRRIIDYLISPLAKLSSEAMRER